MAQSKPQNVFAPWDDPNEVPLIRFRNVTKRFGTFTAIDSLDLDIYRKEFFALLGPSGCGKTTLMRMLASALSTCSCSRARQRMLRFSSTSRCRAACRRRSSRLREARRINIPSSAPMASPMRATSTNFQAMPVHP